MYTTLYIIEVLHNFYQDKYCHIKQPLETLKHI